MVVVLRFSPPLSSSYRFRRLRTAGSRANPLQLNILHVNTFTSNILRAVARPRVNKFKDLAGPGNGPSPKAPQFLQLSHISIFYMQLLSIQRSSSCLPAKMMIPKDHRGRGIYLVPRVPRKIAVLSHLHSKTYQQLLWIQRFCLCSYANPMIPKDHGERVYPFLRNTF